MIRTLSRCGSALGLTLLLWGAPAFAFEPMPPIMQTLLEVFPEENGRFVDEPFGTTPEMPEEARPLFETFRVVVPSVDDIEKTLARLFAASSRLPIKKITRYDRNPGAPGLPGFRGVWCQTEDESQIGFSIVTINENRFLIWAKMGYYPFFANDSINPKVRDQYARDVSQYLAGLDLKVPDNEVPPASGRGLPEGMELFPRRRVPLRMQSLDPRYGFSELATIRSWGLSGVVAFVPDSQMIESIISSAPDTLWCSPDSLYIQHHLDPDYYNAQRGLGVRNLTRSGFDSLQGGRYVFELDRFGRVRFHETAEGEEGVPPSVYFPMSCILTEGIFQLTRCCAYDARQENTLIEVGTFSGGYFYPRYDSAALADAASQTDSRLETIGHFLNFARRVGLPFHPTEGVRIRKFVVRQD